MALMRCEIHPPMGTKRTYVSSVKPVGFPATALICGRKDCDRPALIWLERDQKSDYDAGQRIFQPQSFVTKVCAG